MPIFTARHAGFALLAVSLALPGAAWAQTKAAASNALDPAVIATSTTPDSIVTATTATPAAAAPAAELTGNPRERVEQRIADMHATLHITDAQEAEWDRFSQVMLDNAQAMVAMHTQQAATSGTATAEQIMQTYSDAAKQHAVNVEKLTTAFHPLYAALSAEQKLAADDMFRMRQEEHKAKQGG